MFRFNVLTADKPITINPLINDTDDIIKIIHYDQQLKQKLKCKISVYQTVNYDNQYLFHIAVHHVLNIANY